MKKMLIVLGAAILGLTGLSATTASATGNHDGGLEVEITCEDVPVRILWFKLDAEEITDFASDLYGDVHEALSGAAVDGQIDLNGGAPGGLVTLTVTGDETGGTITLSDEGEVIASASLTDDEFKFEASVEVENFLSASVSFYKDRLGQLCGDAPFTVCLSNTVFLVEADALADYLTENPTAVVINSSVGCPGTPGSDGDDGADGADGSDGADGADGAAGPAGPAGQTVVVEKVVEVPVAAPVQLPRTS